MDFISCVDKDGFRKSSHIYIYIYIYIYIMLAKSTSIISQYLANFYSYIRFRNNCTYGSMVGTFMFIRHLLIFQCILRLTHDIISIHLVM